MKEACDLAIAYRLIEQQERFGTSVYSSVVTVSESYAGYWPDDVRFVENLPPSYYRPLPTLDNWLARYLPQRPSVIRLGR